MGYQDLKQANEELILDDERAQRAIPRGLPTWVGLHTTTQCNLKCTFCLQADGLVPVARMGEEVFMRAAEQLFPTARVVQLTASGEPLLTPRLPEVLNVLRHYEVKLDVITNGTLLRDEALMVQLEELADSFAFSLEGATPGTYGAFRKGADFHDVLANLRRWNQLRLKRPYEQRSRLIVTQILMHSTIREVEAMLEIVHALRGDVLTLSHLAEHRPEVQGESLRSDPARSNHYLARARARARALGITLWGPADLPLTREQARDAAGREWPPPVSPDEALLEAIRQELSPPVNAGHRSTDPGRWEVLMPPLPGGGPRCHYLWRKTYLSPTGEVLTCCHPDARPVGNLLTEPFAGIWRGGQYREYRERVHSKSPLPVCDGCFIIGKAGRELRETERETRR